MKERKSQSVEKQEVSLCPFLKSLTRLTRSAFLNAMRAQMADVPFPPAVEKTGAVKVVIGKRFFGA